MTTMTTAAMPGVARKVAHKVALPASKEAGDISSAFVSLSGTDRPPLPPKFRVLKKALVEGKEDAVVASWNRLLREIKRENDVIAEKGSGIIPTVDFSSLEGDLGKLKDEIQKRGAVVVRGVVPEGEARAYKSEIEEYVRMNPDTKGYYPLYLHDPTLGLWAID